MPRKKFFYRSKSIKILNCSRTLGRPDRPVRSTCQSSRSCQTDYKNLDRSDCLRKPIRPVSPSCYQFWSSIPLQYQICFMESSMKYMLIVHMLDSIVVAIFFYRLDKVSQVCLETNLIRHVNKNGGSRRF